MHAPSGADVVVVGGGPAGSATAALLASAGHDVLVLEQAAFPREKPCAEYLSPGVVDCLGRLGALPAVEAGSPDRPGGMWIIGPRHRFRLGYPAATGTDGRRALGLSRPVFDRIMLDHARTRGVRVHERARATGLLHDGDRVAGVRARIDGVDVEVRARMVVGADGVHSTVARSVGVETAVAWPRRLGLVARFSGVGGLDDAGEMHVGTGLYCGLARVGGGLVSAGLVVGLGDKPAGERVESYFHRRIAELPGAAFRLAGAERVTPIRGVGPIARRARRTAGPGWLLVGDAAGFTDPFTGEGVFRALRGAELAANAISNALLAGDAPDPERGYRAARRAAFAERERVTRIIQALLHWPAAFDRLLGHLDSRPAVADRLGGVLGDYCPAGSVLSPGAVWTLCKPW